MDRSMILLIIIFSLWLFFGFSRKVTDGNYKNYMDTPQTGGTPKTYT